MIAKTAKIRNALFIASAFLCHKVFAQKADYFNAIGLAATDEIVKQCILSVGFEKVYTKVGYPAQEMTLQPDTITAMLSREAYLEFRSKSTASCNAYKVGYILEIRSGKVVYMVCYDTVMLEQMAKVLDISSNYAEEKSKSRRGYYIVPEKDGEHKEVWYKNATGAIVRARYNKSGLLTTVFASTQEAKGSPSYDEYLKIIKSAESSNQPRSNEKAQPSSSQYGTSTASSNVQSQKNDAHFSGYNSRESNLLEPYHGLSDFFTNLMEQAAAGFSGRNRKNPWPVYERMENAILEMGPRLLRLEQSAVAIGKADSKIKREMEEIQRLCIAVRKQIPIASVAFGLAARQKTNQELFAQYAEQGMKAMGNMASLLKSMETKILVAKAK